MKKDELIKLIKEMNFNEKDVFISCQPEVSSFDMVNGEGIEIIQYETLISIKHQEITRKYTKIGSMKIYEDEELKEEEKKIPEKLFGEPRHIYNENELYIVDKVNEIIDYLKSKGE